MICGMVNLLEAWDSVNDKGEVQLWHIYTQIIIMTESKVQVNGGKGRMKAAVVDCVLWRKENFFMNEHIKSGG